MLEISKGLHLALSPGLEESQERGISPHAERGGTGGSPRTILQAGPWEATAAHSFYTGVGERLPGSMCLSQGRGEFKGQQRIT